jgi:hypothetical protein
MDRHFRNFQEEQLSGLIQLMELDSNRTNKESKEG